MSWNEIAMGGDTTDYRGCAIPPEVYDLAFGWDPGAEIDRLLFLAGEYGGRVSSALELGCGTGRLLAALSRRVPVVCGLEISSAMAEFARRRCDFEIHVGDMSDFALARRFDLIYASANTIRHALRDRAIESMWRCVAAHLEPEGVFVADLELGFDAECAKLCKPACWSISRGAREIETTWCVVRAPDRQSRRCRVEWTFRDRSGAADDCWKQAFELRTYDAAEFVKMATAGSGLRYAGVFENREPDLLPREIARAVGRMLVVLQRAD